MHSLFGNTLKVSGKYIQLLFQPIVEFAGGSHGSLYSNIRHYIDANGWLW